MSWGTRFLIMVGLVVASQTTGRVIAHEVAPDVMRAVDPTPGLPLNSPVGTERQVVDEHGCVLTERVVARRNGLLIVVTTPESARLCGGLD